MGTESLDRRRLTKLAVGAIAILAVGAMLRPADPAAEVPISMTESPTLRVLSRRGQFRDMAEFVAEQVGAIGPHLVYLPMAGRSGVLWRTADSAVTAGDGHAVQIVEIDAAEGGATPVSSAGAPTDAPRWVLLAARTPEGGIVSSLGLSGGVVRLACGEREQPALVVSAPLGRPLAGAGVFDLDGTLLAVVAACGRGYAALPVGDIEAMRRAPETGAVRAWGVELGALDSAAQRAFGADSGAVVAAIALTGAGDRAGLRPGDVVLNPEALETEPDSTTAVQVIRAGRSLRLNAPAPAAPGDAFGIELTAPEEGVEVLEVAPDSPAERAGIRPGDRIIRVGELERPSREIALRALRATGEPLYVVFRRGRHERGTFILP